MKASTRILFWRKATAWLGILAILSTLLISLPIPQAFAAPTASGDATHTVSNGNFGDMTTVEMTFSEALSDANKISCPQGFPGSLVCYSLTNTFQLGGTWGQQPIAILRNPGSATDLIAVFPSSATSDAGATIGFNGFGGITNQSFDVVQAAQTLEASYTASVAQIGNVSLLQATFSSGDLSDQNALNGNGTCPGLPAGDQGFFCYDLSSTYLLSGSFTGSPAVTQLARSNTDKDDLFVTFDAADIVPDPPGITNQTITFGGFGGISGGITYDFAEAQQQGGGGGNPPAVGEALFIDNPGGSGLSLLQLQFGSALNPNDNASACPGGLPDENQVCFDEDNAVDASAANLAGGISVTHVYIDENDDDSIYVVMSGTGGVSDFDGTITFKSGYAGVGSDTQFDIVETGSGGQSPNAQGVAEYTASINGGANSEIKLGFSSSLDNTNAVQCPQGLTFHSSPVCFSTSNTVSLNSANAASGVSIANVYVSQDNDGFMYVILDAANGLENTTGTLTVKSGNAGITSDQQFEIALAGGGEIEAATNLTATTGEDTDTQGPGLDGRDFLVTWDGASTEPHHFVSRQIFIVSSSTGGSLTASNVLSTGCSGGACVPLASYNDFSYQPGSLPQFNTIDSEGNAFSQGTTYQACVLLDATTDVFECSANFNVTSDTVTDNLTPFINHFPVHSAEESAAAIINAAIFDEQTTQAEFANTGDGGPERFQLSYGADVQNGRTTVDAAQVSGSLFQFTIPSGAVPAAGGTIEYYLRAKDAAGNETFICNYQAGESGDENDCRTSPFIINTLAAGSKTIAGTVTSGGSNLSGAKVIAGGFAKAAVTTDGSGDYTISGLAANNGYDVFGYKAGNCHDGRFEVLSSTNLTSIDFSLGETECTFSGGGSGLAPIVVGSNAEGISNFDVSQSLLVFMDQGLDPSTVNDADASDSGSNVFLTIDGSTKIAGVVTFCESQTQIGECSVLGSGEGNIIIFNPASDITTNSGVSLVITDSVLSTTGQSIAGNEPTIGHVINFSTGGGTFAENDINTNFGNSGQYMPPFVRAIVPSPAQKAAPATNIVLEFNEPIDQSTANKIKLTNSDGQTQSVTRTVSNNGRFVVVNPDANLAVGEYTMNVLGSVANVNGVTMRPAGNENDIAFSSFFEVTNDSFSAPTVFAFLSNNSVDIPVNSIFEFGLDGALDPTTVSPSSITLKRGTNTESAVVDYDASSNSVTVTPNSVLAPNTTYTVNFSGNLRDIRGDAPAAQTFSYTTGGLDTTKPTLVDARCDDFSCVAFFSEPMNHELASGSGFANSVLADGNIILQANGQGADLALSSTPMSYDAFDNTLRVEGLSLTVGDTFTFTIGENAHDISGNAFNILGENVRTGVVEDPQETFGAMGDMGMFGPPTAEFSGGSIGGQFMPGDFGSFTTDEFFSGTAVMAFPFNATAGQDSNVFQIGFSPGVAIQDNDKLEITFPTGTTVTNAKPDGNSPFKDDMNEAFGIGKVAFDTALDSDGVEVDAGNRMVTVQFDVTNGSPGANDFFTVDLQGIQNPNVPRGPESSGYSVSMKLKRGSTTLGTFDSMPYFIQSGGNNSIQISMYAGSLASPVSGANGDVTIFGGGPSGPLNSVLTLTNGIISQVDGENSGALTFSNLPDGCYGFGTEPFLSLNGNDFFGQSVPEQACVTGGSTTNIDLILGSASGSATAPVTVKFTGLSNFGGRDIDIFAGGPGSFVVRTLENVGVPDSNGYTLNLPTDGLWFLGVGPAVPQGSSFTIPENLPGVPPPPVDLEVSGIGETPTVSVGGFGLPPGATFDDATETLTLNFTAADKTVVGSVQDGSTNAIATAEVFLHSQGFGAPAFAQTNSAGGFAIDVADYGVYEIGAFKDGLPPTFQQIELQPDGSDAGSDPDVIFKGELITDANPLVLNLNKADYSISGKVLDSDGNGIAYAPVFGTDANGDFVGGGTDSNGSYTLFVGAGTWTVKAELPPDSTDQCGTFSKTVTVTTASKSSQNIEPSTGTCHTLYGNVSVGGTALSNVFLMVEEWDSGEDQPVVGGVFRPSSTNSTGDYSVEVAGSKTYRISTFDPTFGELFEVTTVSAASKEVNIAQASTGTLNFAFTGGTSDMSAFLEVENRSSGFRKTENISNLSSATALTVIGGTYDFRLNVFGFGEFEGIIAAGTTATLDLTTQNYVTLSGTVKDTSDNVLANAAVTLQGTGDNSNVVQDVRTDSSGSYSLATVAGEYKLSAGLANYIPSALTTVNLTQNTSDQNITLTPGANTISGTIYESDGTTPMTDGFVTAEDSSGAFVGTPTDSSNGTFSLNVADGNWTLRGLGPLHAETSGGTVTVSGSDLTGKNITLTADATRESTSGSKALAAGTGGTVNDTGNTGIKMTAGAGVLDTAGDVTVSMARSFTAPQTSNFQPLGDASFDITAAGGTTIKDLNGNIEIVIDYTTLLASLPSGVSETDLQFVYYSTERGEYVVVEGGFTIDEANNTATASVDHLTSFALVVSNSALAPSTPSSLTATVASGTQVNLDWTQTSGATSYNVYRDTDPNGSFARLGSEPTVGSGSTTTYSDTSLTEGTTYYYKIAAVNTDGESAATSAVSATPSEATTGTSSTTVTPTSSSQGGGDFGSSLEETAQGEALEELYEATIQIVTLGDGELITFDFAQTDYESHWAEAYIDKIVSLGIAKGIGENAFDPNTTVTRAQLIKMVLNAAGHEIPTSVAIRPFRDVAGNSWYSTYVKAAKNLGIVEGYSDRTFRPNEQINRAEALKILIEGGMGLNIVLDPTQSMLANFNLDENPFSDVDLNEWYAHYVLFAYTNDIVSGYPDGTFGPGRSMTRAEFAKVIVEGMQL
jgi:hypothetical protein